VPTVLQTIDAAAVEPMSVPTTLPAATATTATTGTVTTEQTSVGMTALTTVESRPLLTDRRQWARNKRPRSQSTKSEATTRISCLADEQRRYYTRRLEMDEAEHARRMEVLEIKKLYYSKLLGGLLGEE
jgi:hypothetical protein